jgi:hypothetical protein
MISTLMNIGDKMGKSIKKNQMDVIWEELKVIIILIKNSTYKCNL